jgi:ribose transport system substrate-binding protein
MKIAVFTKNHTNPAYGAARLGAERAAQLFGAEVLHFVPEKGDDAQQQSALIDEALALQPDAFVLSPVHATDVDAALTRIQAAGIPIVSFVSPILAVPTVCHVSSDDYLLACAIAERLFAHLHGAGRVLVVTGPVDSFTSLERLRGFLDTAQRHPAILIADQIAGDYRRDSAFQRTSQWLAENAQLDACLVANDIMALGVLDALQAAQRSASVVGVNAIPEAVAAIGQGRMLATADFNAMQMAFVATECAVMHLRGEAVPAVIELPVQIVDMSNCALWDRPYEQRALLSLKDLLP